MELRRGLIALLSARANAGRSVVQIWWASRRRMSSAADEPASRQVRCPSRTIHIALTVVPTMREATLSMLVAPSVQ